MKTKLLPLICTAILGLTACQREDVSEPQQPAAEIQTAPAPSQEPTPATTGNDLIRQEPAPPPNAHPQ